MQAPDIDEGLGEWEIAPLTTGFAIDHAHLVAGTDLTGSNASDGRIEQT